jgi:hypothetical protein
MKRLCLAVVCIAILLAIPGPALAETGRQDFTITYSGRLAQALSNDPGRRVVATGIITGVGEEEFLSQGPGPSPGTFVGASNLVFPDGTVGVVVEGVVEQRSFGPGGCFMRNTISGTYDITGGTEAFAGASGSGSFTGVNLVFGEPSAQGCSLDDARLISTIRLRGSMTLPNSAAA